MAAVVTIPKSSMTRSEVAEERDGARFLFFFYLAFSYLASSDATSPIWVMSRNYFRLMRGALAVSTRQLTLRDCGLRFSELRRKRLGRAAGHTTEI